MVACDIKTMLKQLTFRFQYLEGVQDFLFVVLTAALGILGKYNSFFRNGIFDAFEPLIEAIINIGSEEPEYELSCSQIGFAFGTLP